MAQISIPLSNKVGYSMYWSSMWDSKINFSRNLKESIYIDTFIPLIFEDNISNKILKTVKFKDFLKFDSFVKYNLHIKSSNLNQKSFYNYLISLNKLVFFKSKVWVLKYQKWIIIYFYMYLPKFNTLKQKKRFIYIKKKAKKSSINNLFSFYKSISLKLKYSYNFFNNSINKHYF